VREVAVPAIDLRPKFAPGRFGKQPHLAGDERNGWRAQLGAKTRDEIG